MNRLAPLIRRPIRQRGSFPIAIAIAQPIEVEEAARWVADAKLFATGWVAGLVVFGTLFA